jgi:hypothetical protein
MRIDRAASAGFLVVIHACVIGAFLGGIGARVVKASELTEFRPVGKAKNVLVCNTDECHKIGISILQQFVFDRAQAMGFNFVRTFNGIGLRDLHTDGTAYSEHPRSAHRAGLVEIFESWRFSVINLLDDRFHFEMHRWSLPFVDDFNICGRSAVEPYLTDWGRGNFDPSTLVRTHLPLDSFYAGLSCFRLSVGNLKLFSYFLGRFNRIESRLLCLLVENASLHGHFSELAIEDNDCDNCSGKK